MSSRLEWLIKNAERIASENNPDDTRQISEACTRILLSVNAKRRSDVENELISIALDGDCEDVADTDRQRLAEKGFAELVYYAMQSFPANFSE